MIILLIITTLNLAVYVMQKNNSCYYSWAHGTAVLITKRAKARLSGQLFRGMQAPYVRNSGKIIKNEEFLPGFCILLTRREAAITQRKLPSSFDKAQAENVAFILWRKVEGAAKDGCARVSSGMYDHSSCPIFVQEWQFFLLKRLQRYLFWRVVRHIKNAREENFTESWKHSASDSKNNVDVSSLNTSSPNTLHEFP